MQDKPGRYPQRDEGMLPALILVEAERFETQDVAVEAQGSPDIPYPPVGMVSIGYLYRSGKFFRGESVWSGCSMPVDQGMSNVLPTVA